MKTLTTFSMPHHPILRSECLIKGINRMFLVTPARVLVLLLAVERSARSHYWCLRRYLRTTIISYVSNALRQARFDGHESLQRSFGLFRPWEANRLGVSLTPTFFGEMSCVACTCTRVSNGNTGKKDFFEVVPNTRSICGKGHQFRSCWNPSPIFVFHMFRFPSRGGHLFRLTI